jgi:hypothetical protein
MSDSAVTITAEDRMVMERIVTDADATAALDLVRRLWERLAAHEKQRMRTPLDR